jgi:hypothetical protein
MEKNQEFIISGTNDKLWNFQELISYLANNQRKHISLKINPEAICLETLGIYRLLDNFEFTTVDIYTDNQLEKHSKYNIIVDSHNEFLDHLPDIPLELHDWTGNKIFLVFYHRPTASRLGVASYLFNHYREQSVIHFSYDTDIDGIQLYEFDKLATLRKESIGDVSVMLPHMPLLAFENHSVDKVMKWYDYSRDSSITMYRDIFVDIVAETHVAGKTFFPTEKTIRPMWLRKPFIIFGSKNYLCYLRQMGFRTFGDFWDEDYDGYEAADRFLKIQLLIDLLASKSFNELEKMYWDMQYTLDHNYNLLMSQQYNKHIKEII